jgi:formate-dependent nitrite reductase membrane component NrfD
MKRLKEALSQTIPPEDGRNIDPHLGELAGEGALQRVRELEPPPYARSVWTEPLPDTEQESPTYYELPMLKEPVWKWYIPAYFYVGGLSGACAALGASADLLGGRGMARLSRQCRLIAATGVTASAVLLIADLGRPARFLNMLRVFRPSSPMNLGTWLLSTFGACAGLAALPTVLAVPAPVRRLADGAGIGAGVLGLPMTGYTGVLLANTAVPLWQGARRAMPILFSSSGAATAASILEILGDSDEGAAVTFRFGVIAKATELAMTLLLEREVSVVPRVARPLRSGFSGALWRAAQVAGAASLILSVVGRKRTWPRRVAGVLGAAAALGLRFALFHGGKRSARDPRASFEQQRAGYGASELVHRKHARTEAEALDEGR